MATIVLFCSVSFLQEDSSRYHNVVGNDVLNMSKKMYWNSIKCIVIKAMIISGKKNNVRPGN